MAMQPCRSALARGQQALRAASLRAACYSTTATTNTTPDASTAYRARRGRWEVTPEGMSAPIRMDFAKKPQNKIWAVNNDPRVLNEMYDELLGPNGSRMLPDELKWLAITHKSFDQGRRGFNDKLALMGRMTLVMEAAKDIVSQEPLPGAKAIDEFESERQPFESPQLSQVDNLNVRTPQTVASKESIYKLAQSVGMLNVVRWKPRLPHALESSGVEVVMNGAVLAIIGAITLQHGAEVASKVVRERILGRLRQF
ncbi:hypothetical protein V2G26_016421 [Clonostachys chloroleuca]|uniref:RNase III domain-containing protein n=1 Tax=Clonostachys chloroleuca TaxID=1926264 RepID=A0AA35MGR7_9HYPO|nr:unnamed protein product [Clonostachys chloroleuca]